MHGATIKIGCKYLVFGTLCLGILVFRNAGSCSGLIKKGYFIFLKLLKSLR